MTNDQIEAEGETVTRAEYEGMHQAALDAYEAATPSDTRYSATAIRKAVDAALAYRATLASRPTPSGEGETVQPVQVGQKWRWLGRMETEFFTPGQCYTILSVHPGTDYTSVYITDNNGAGSNGGQGHSWSFRPEAGSDNFLDYFELAASRSTPSGEKGWTAEEIRNELSPSAPTQVR